MRKIKFLINSIIVPIVVGIISAIITPMVNLTISRKRMVKDKLRGLLSRIMDCERETNPSVTDNKKEDYISIYASYYTVLTGLRIFVDTYGTSISCENDEMCKQLIEEIDQKLVIYKTAFIIGGDIQQIEQSKYWYKYIEPEETKIQQLAEELLKRL